MLFDEAREGVRERESGVRDYDVALSYPQMIDNSALNKSDIIPSKGVNTTLYTQFLACLRVV